MKCLLAAIVFAVAFPIFAQKATSSRSPQFSCRFKGCQSFRQLEKTSDPDVKNADRVCFYDGDNPAGKDKDAPTTDEFFLVMDGRRSDMSNGIRPGVFVNVVKDGLPEGFYGWGPKHGGLGESGDVKKVSLFEDGKVGIARTYDDLGDNVRFAYFFFGQQSVWIGKEVKLTDEPLLRFYEETLIRKSTGRFVQTMIDFDSRFVEGGEIWEPGPFTVKYKGQCFSTKEI